MNLEVEQKVPCSCKRGKETLGSTWYARIIDVRLATWKQVVVTENQNALSHIYKKHR